MPRTLSVIATVIVMSSIACARNEETAPAVATPHVTLPRTDALVGGPLETRYRFVVAPDARPFPEDYWVFVHFNDADGEMMWTDDHEPPTPTRQWKPGATIEYTRTILLPKFPYVGETRVQIGLFSRRTGERLPLNAQTDGQRAYTLARFDLRLQSDPLIVVFKDGWHPTEQAEASATEWQWSKQQATLAFRNPRRNVLFYLQCDRATGFPDAQHVELRIGDALVDAFSLAPNQADLRKVALTAEQLGGGDTVEIQLSVDRTFVPATIPEMKSNDPRELGVRVFRAFAQPL